MTENKTMNPRIKELWLEALRSGEYAQGKHELQTTNGKFCCLGVLCEIAVKEGVIDPAAPDTIDDMPTIGLYYGPEGNRECVALPDVVEKWAGTPGTSPAIDLDDEDLDDEDRDDKGTDTVWLAEENDSGHSFEEIADLIDKYL